MDSSSQLKLQELQQLTTQVLYPDEDSEYYIQDVWQATHSRIAQYCNELLCVKGETSEEEATICLALLMAYHVSPYRVVYSVQQLLNRSYHIIPKLSSSLLKCELLTYCYGEVYEEELLKEAYTILMTCKGSVWQKREVMNLLSLMEENKQYSFTIDGDEYE